MHTLQRSCCRAAICGTAGKRAPTLGPWRAFSRSSARTRGALPVYLEPSLPHLSALLSTLNAQVLLPQHLSKEQQKLVYSKENRARLEAEPIEITLGDVTLPLHHLDRNRLPARAKQLHQVVRSSATADDWENVLRALEGFRNAGIAVKPHWQELVVRKLNEHGMPHLVLKALQRASNTGVRLSNHGVLVMVLRGVHDQAASSGWDKEETAKAYRMAKQVVELMDDEVHHRTVKNGDKIVESDWRSDPPVIALPTEMAAVLAESALKQTEYMTQLGALSERALTTPAQFSKKVDQKRFLTHYSYQILQIVIVWNALKTSRQFLGTDAPLSADAQRFEVRAEQVIGEGSKCLNTLSTLQDGSELKSNIVLYIHDIIKQCQS
ncbi:hypothetical protein ACN47E_005994 [Coniothyrium glycines]